ncbi:uncharacterized protein LOC144822560 [Lissotriton helveticus]
MDQHELPSTTSTPPSISNLPAPPHQAVHGRSYKKRAVSFSLGTVAPAPVSIDALSVEAVDILKQISVGQSAVLNAIQVQGPQLMQMVLNLEGIHADVSALQRSFQALASTLSGAFHNFQVSTPPPTSSPSTIPTPIPAQSTHTLKHASNSISTHRTHKHKKKQRHTLTPKALVPLTTASTDMQQDTTPPDTTPMQQDTTPPDATPMQQDTTASDTTPMQQDTTPPGTTPMQQDTTSPDTPPMQQDTTPPDTRLMQQSCPTPPDTATPHITHPDTITPSATYTSAIATDQTHSTTTPTSDSETHARTATPQTSHTSTSKTLPIVLPPPPSPKEVCLISFNLCPVTAACPCPKPRSGIPPLPIPLTSTPAKTQRKKRGQCPRTDPPPPKTKRTSSPPHRKSSKRRKKQKKKCAPLRYTLCYP